MNTININYARALRFAVSALYGQKDKGGAPLVSHAIRMADTFPLDSDEQILAVLHDVLEDAEGASLQPRLGGGYVLRAEDAGGLPLPERVGLGLLDVTRKPNEDYDAYLLRVSFGGHLSASVKLADVRDHLAQASTLPASLRRRYERAVAMLENHNE